MRKTVPARAWFPVKYWVSEFEKNVIYEGTPHGNAELAQSEIIFMLS